MENPTPKKRGGFLKYFFTILITAFLVTRVYGPAVRKADKYDALMKDLNTLITEYKALVKQWGLIDTNEDNAYEVLGLAIIDFSTVVDAHK